MVSLTSADAFAEDFPLVRKDPAVDALPGNDVDPAVGLLVERYRPSDVARLGTKLPPDGR